MSLTRSRVQDTRTRIANELRMARADAAMADASAIEKALPGMLERMLAMYDDLLATFDLERLRRDQEIGQERRKGDAS